MTMQGNTPDLRRRLRAQRDAHGGRCKPPTWGRYPLARYEAAGDADVRFRARVDHAAWSVMAAIVDDDLEWAEGRAREMVAHIRGERSRRMALAKNVIDLGDYRGRRFGSLREGGM